jgi:hypothetical protein
MRGLLLRLAFNIAISVAVIVGATWLSKRHPTTAGFVTALPITTMLVLLLGRIDVISLEEQARFAKSLLAGIPLAALFVVPFVGAPRLGLSFWSAFVAGLLLLTLGYALHRWLFAG